MDEANVQLDRSAVERAFLRFCPDGGRNRERDGVARADPRRFKAEPGGKVAQRSVGHAADSVALDVRSAAVDGKGRAALRHHRRCGHVRRQRRGAAAGIERDDVRLGVPRDRIAVASGSEGRREVAQTHETAVRVIVGMDRSRRAVHREGGGRTHEQGARKAAVEHAYRVAEADLVAAAAEDDRNQALPVSHGGRDEAAACGACRAGLESVRAGIGVAVTRQELVGCLVVFSAEGDACPRGIIEHVRVLREQGRGEGGGGARRHAVAAVETGGVREGHGPAAPFGPCGHHRGKIALRPAELFAQRGGRVAGGDNHRRREQLVDGIALSDGQRDVDRGDVRADFPRVRADRDGAVFGDLAARHRLIDHVDGHELCETRGVSGDVGIFGVVGLAPRDVHKYIAGSVGDGVRGKGRRRQRADQCRRQQQGSDFFPEFHGRVLIRRVLRR